MERIESCVKLLKEWLARQPHLPQNVPDALLNKCLIASDYSIERSKNLIDLFFTMRTRTPELFSGRTFSDPEIKDTLEILDIFELSKMVGTSRVFFARLKSDDVEKYHFDGTIRAYTMFDDIQLFNDTKFYDGEIFIVDLEKSTLKHITKLSLTLANKIVQYTTEARPTNLKEVHFVHTPPFVEKLTMLLRTIVKSEIMDLMHLHPNPETLQKFVPKDVLPKEYGGTDLSIEDYKNQWDEKVSKYQHIFDGEDSWKVDETKRPANNPYVDKFSTQGSFRTLDID